MHHCDIWNGFSRAVFQTVQGSFPLLAGAAESLQMEYGQDPFEQGAVFTAAMLTEMCSKLKLSSLHYNLPRSWASEERPIQLVLGEQFLPILEGKERVDSPRLS